MKKLLILLFCLISLKSVAQTWYSTGTSNLQRTPTSKGWMYRNNMGSLGNVTWYTAPQLDSLLAIAGGSGVTSFNTRTGAVVPLVGDYSAFYPLLNGTGATGTWGIGITGNSGTVTNGVYTTTFNALGDARYPLLSGSYVNPSWITSLPWTKITATPTTLSGYGITDAQPLITAGTTLQYWRGDKTFQTLNTAAVPESTNLYYTNARGIGSTLTGYTSGSGTVSASDNILQAIQKLNGNIGALVTGVSSFNTRTGAITLNSSDVTTALGFTPEDVANKTATQSSSTTTYPNWSGVTNYVGGLSSVYQPLNAKLTAISALANASGVLTNDGSGGFSYTSPVTPSTAILNNNLQNYNGIIAIGDSQLEGYGITGGGNVGSQNWFNIVQASTQKPTAPTSAIGFTNFTNPTLYGITLGGSTSITGGPTNTGILLQSGATITFTAASNSVDFWFTGNTSGGNIGMTYNGSPYRTVTCNGVSAINQSSFSGTFNTPSSASGTYVLTATGGTVLITGLFTSVNEPSGKNANYFIRDGVASQSFGSFSAANISATTGLLQNTNGLFLNALGQNSIFNVSSAITVADYVAAVLAYNSAINIGGNKMVYMMPPHIPQATILDTYANYHSAVVAACLANNIPLIDLDAIGLTGADYAADSIHFNALGHALIASAVNSFLSTNDISNQNIKLVGSQYLDQSGSKQYSRSSGTNTYTATILPTFAALTEGQVINIFFANANTSGTVTLNINGLGAYPLRKFGQTALVSGDIGANQAVSLLFDGTYFQILGDATNSVVKLNAGDASISGTFAAGGNVNATGAVQATSFVSGYDFRGSSYGGGKALYTSGTAITESATTSTELSYVAGVTSAIQTQLNSKIGLTGLSVSGLPLSYDNTTGIFSIANAGASAAGVLSTGTQTWAGNKTNSGNFAVGGTLTVTGTTRLNANVGFNVAPSTTASILNNLAITGSTSGVEGFSQRGTVANTVTGQAFYQDVLMSTAASTAMTDLIGYNARTLSLGSGTTIARLIGFLAPSNLTGNAGTTLTAGFLSDVSAGTGIWGWYNNGGAKEYHGTGASLFGSATPTAGAPILDVTGSIGSTTLAVSSPVYTDANSVLTTTVPAGYFTFRGSGQTTLVAGTKAISVTGVTTSSQVFVNAISQGGTVSTTFEYAAVPTAGTITITALTNGNITNTLDTSTLSYYVIN